jgi:hypothetical protein
MVSELVFKPVFKPVHLLFCIRREVRLRRRWRRGTLFLFFFLIIIAELNRITADRNDSRGGTHALSVRVARVVRIHAREIASVVAIPLEETGPRTD